MNQSASGKAPAKHPNCLTCKHYFVTWEPSRPHGCRAYGFKSQSYPSVEVFKCSGVVCQQFQEKPLPARR